MIKKIIIYFALSLSVSLSMCVAADVLVPNQEHDIEGSILSPRARIQRAMNCPEYSSNRFSNDWVAVFEADSAIVKRQISEFFVMPQEQKKRLTDFNTVYDYGRNLFANNARPSSKDVMVTYLAFADLLSERPPHSTNKILLVNWRDPANVLNILNSEEHRDKSYALPFQYDYFFLPIVSQDGILSLEELNLCVANKIVCVGIPYGKKFTAFDREKGQSILEFALHDVDHGNFYKHGPERLELYNDMQRKNNKVFEAVFLWIYHEIGYAKINGIVGRNPIQNSLRYIKGILGKYDDNNTAKSRKIYLSELKDAIFILNTFKPYDESLTFSQNPKELDVKSAEEYLCTKFNEFHEVYGHFLPH